MKQVIEKLQGLYWVFFTLSIALIFISTIRILNMFSIADNPLIAKGTINSVLKPRIIYTLISISLLVLSAIYYTKSRRKYSITSLAFVLILQLINVIYYG